MATDSQAIADAPQPNDIRDLVFVGFNSRVAAVHRDTGAIIWKWKAPSGRSSHVAILLDSDRLIVSVHGYTYGIDAISGKQLWYNEFQGFGYGYPTLASIHGNTGSAAAAAMIAAQQAAASSGS